MTGFQHCPACATEYVAGVVVCADCGGPLSPGARPDPSMADAATTAPAIVPGSTPDMKLAELPGLQADFAVRALTLEGIVCGVECQGIRKIHLPDSPPHEPLAVTLPVSIYVASDKLSEAQSILRSLEPSDVIGAQWEAAEEETESDTEDAPSSRIREDWAPTEDLEPPPFAEAGSPRGESTTGRLLLFLAVAAAIVFFLAR